MNLDRPIIAGHSLGGSITLSYALSWQDHVAGLVLLGADPELRALALACEPRRLSLPTSG